MFHPFCSHLRKQVTPLGSKTERIIIGYIDILWYIEILIPAEILPWTVLQWKVHSQNAACMAKAQSTVAAWGPQMNLHVSNASRKICSKSNRVVFLKLNNLYIYIYTVYIYIYTVYIYKAIQSDPRCVTLSLACHSIISFSAKRQFGPSAFCWFLSLRRKEIWIHEEMIEAYRSIKLLAGSSERVESTLSTSASMMLSKKRCS